MFCTQHASDCTGNNPTHEDKREQERDQTKIKEVRKRPDIRYTKNLENIRNTSISD